MGGKAIGRSGDYYCQKLGGNLVGGSIFAVDCSSYTDEIAQMVERRTVEPEARGLNPPYCMSQAIGCQKSLPNRRTTEYQCTQCNNADDKRPYDTLMTV